MAKKKAKVEHIRVNADIAAMAGLISLHGGQTSREMADAYLRQPLIDKLMEMLPALEALAASNADLRAKLDELRPVIEAAKAPKPRRK